MQWKQKEESLGKVGKKGQIKKFYKERGELGGKSILEREPLCGGMAEE